MLRSCAEAASFGVLPSFHFLPPRTGESPERSLISRHLARTSSHNPRLWAKGPQGIGRHHPEERDCLTNERQNQVNADLVKQALAKVPNPNILINLISRRVRQLNAGGGARSRSLLANTGSLGVADIALLEIIEDKMGFVMPEIIPLTRPAGQNRRRPQGWGRQHVEKKAA